MLRCASIHEDTPKGLDTCGAECTLESLVSVTFGWSQSGVALCVVGARRRRWDTRLRPR